MEDKSNGYEGVAEHFIRARNHRIGPEAVRRWAKGLRPGTEILDVGCGYGKPISQTLLQEGFSIYGADASPTLVAKFREEFPNVPVECSPIEDSLLFSRTFDAVIAWGVMFILPVESQQILIAKVARALNPSGHFLFTATENPCEWNDNLTDLRSVSLGREWYERELAANGLSLVGTDKDEGENDYFLAVKEKPNSELR